jgi:hypothetical protein
MVACNVLRGDHPLTTFDQMDLQALASSSDAVLVDVREVRRGMCSSLARACLNRQLAHPVRVCWTRIPLGMLLTPHPSGHAADPSSLWACC